MKDTSLKLTSSANNDIVDAIMYRYLLVRVQKYIPAYVTPNQLTLIGFLFGLIAAMVLFIPNPIVLPIASLCLFLWIIFDGLDGLHARRTNQTSEVGELLDHTCDYIVAVVLLFSIFVFFELLSYAFVFVFFIRICAQGIVFVHQVYTKEVFESFVGISTEFFCLSIVFMIQYFCSPANFLVSSFVSNDFVINIVYWLDLNELNIIKLLLFVGYLVGSVFGIIETIRYSRKVYIKRKMIVK